VVLVPGGDLAMDLADPDRVGPIHQPAAIARKVEAVETHYVDVAGATASRNAPDGGTRCAVPPTLADFNRVKHGLAGHPAGWTFSSFRRCVIQGLYASDWLVSSPEPPETGEHP
jgi:hypothetical protein